MKISHPLVEILRNAFVIFGVIIFMTALMNPSHNLTYQEVMGTSGAALLTSLLSLVYYSKNTLSHRARNMRRVIHFILVEVVALTVGNSMGLVSRPSQNIVFALEIMMIYTIVSLVTWFGDQKTSQEINEKLASMRRGKEE